MEPVDGVSLNAPEIIYDNMRSWVVDLFYVYYKTDCILKKNWRDVVTPPESVRLPVPVESVAQRLKFIVEYVDLNRYRDSQISLVLGKIDTKDKVIYIDSGIEVSTSQRRYAIAHELGHFYLNDGNPNSMDCTESRIPDNRREFLADIFAAFLMLPPREKFRYVYDYIEENRKRPVDHEKMMLELSDTAKFPFLRTITSYEYLRLLACYQHNHMENIPELLKERWDISDAKEWLAEPIAPRKLYN